MVRQAVCVIAAATMLLAAASAPAQQGDWRAIQPKTPQELKTMFDQPVEGLETPGEKQVYVIKSELTPAITISSKLSSVRLFDRMAQFGLEGPSHVAYVTGGAVKSAGRGQIAGSTLGESWLLVWFEGSKGWNQLKYANYSTKFVKNSQTLAFDVPFLISLQRKPTSISVGPDGVQLSFSGQAGIVQYMPLLGVNRPKHEVTRRWAQGLPAEIAALCRSWNSRLKAVPLQVTESYEIEAEKDLVTLIHDFRFVELKDDWNTTPSADAPISPAISLAAEHGFPVQFAAKPVDTQSPTYFGPLWVVPNAKQVRIGVPGIVNLIIKVKVPNIPAGRNDELLAKIDKGLQGKAYETGMGWWAAAGCAMAQGTKASLLPYATPQTQELVKAASMRLMHENVFGGENTTDTIIDSKRGRVYLVDYTNHNLRYAGDDESPASEIVRGTFNYAFYTGDWQTVRDKWRDLQAAGVGSYVKNNWIIQSRLNSGGDTYHDVIVGTAHMARMAAVLGKEDDFGLFTYLLARHLLAYYGFEYAELQHARKYDPWFVALANEEMLVWDIYGPFGGLFTPYSQEGYYGPYSGFYEHYYRMDDDIMPRFYKQFLKDHMRRIFGEIVVKNVPDPEPKDGSKWGLLFKLRAAFLDWNHDQLKGWLDKSTWKGKDSVEVDAALYDAKHPPLLVEILNPSLKKVVSGQGVQYQSDGLKHFSLDLDTHTQREPGTYWFGFNAPGAVKAAHSGNTIVFGLTSTGEGKIVGRDTSDPNWVTSVYSYNHSAPTAAQQSAAAQQAKASWMIIGPFEAEGQNEDWDTAFQPEERIALGASYPGPKSRGDGDGIKKGDQLVLKWRQVQMGEGKDTEKGEPLPANTLSCRWGYNQFGYSYLYTRVYSPKAQAVRIGISSQGGQKVWINKELAYANPKNAGRTQEDDRMFDAHLKQGANDVLVKLKNSTFWQTFYFRIMDVDEQAIIGLRYDPRGQ